MKLGKLKEIRLCSGIKSEFRIWVAQHVRRWPSNYWCATYGGGLRRWPSYCWFTTYGDGLWRWPMEMAKLLLVYQATTGVCVSEPQTTVTANFVAAA